MIATPVQVRFSDLDGMGHVNNAVYASYFEIGRVDFMDRAFPGPVAGLKDIPFILARLEIDLLKPIKFGDNIQVETEVGRLGNKSWDFQARIVATGDATRIFARARTVQVAFDYHRQESIPLPADLRSALEGHQSTTF